MNIGDQARLDGVLVSVQHVVSDAHVLVVPLSGGPGYWVRERQLTHVQRGRDLWSTPAHVFDALNREYGFDTDLCASVHNARCPRYFSFEQNALEQSWDGCVAWCNPPYSNVAPWVARARAARNSLIVMLVPGSFETRWFDGAQFQLYRGRIRFDPPPNINASTPRINNALLVFGAPLGFGGWRSAATGERT